MLDLLLLSPVLAGAVAGGLLVGIAVGAWAGLPRGAAWISALLVVGGAAIALGVAIAGLVPGRAGLWLDGMAPPLAAYAAGCLLGALGRSLRLPGVSLRPPLP